MSQTPHCRWSWMARPGRVMWSSEENRAIKAITVPPETSSSPWRSRDNGQAGVAVDCGAGGGGSGGGGGGDGVDSGSPGSGSAATGSAGMTPDSTIHNYSTHVRIILAALPRVLLVVAGALVAAGREREGQATGTELADPSCPNPNLDLILAKHHDVSGDFQPCAPPSPSTTTSPKR